MKRREAISSPPVMADGNEPEQYPIPARSEQRIAWQVDTFHTREEAERAVKFLNDRTIEHRGVSPMRDGTFAVWRR